MLEVAAVGDIKPQLCSPMLWTKGLSEGKVVADESIEEEGSHTAPAGKVGAGDLS